MVVGGSGVGKTRMIERLKEKGDEEEGTRKTPISTDGVDVGEVRLRQVICLHFSMLFHLLNHLFYRICYYQHGILEDKKYIESHINFFYSIIAYMSSSFA